MANELTIFDDQSQLAALQEMFGGSDLNQDLSNGVLASFPVLSFKGKVWRVKFKGEERMVTGEDGEPVSTLHAVIVKASPNISKIYYDRQYTEGDDSAPKCFSLDGIKPDAASEVQQSPTCATCPNNVWGSRITEGGNKTKACADSRRLAVVPYPDLSNDGNGAMLLRVPPASLQALVKLSEQLNKVKVPYQAVVVKIGFEHEHAYPKLKFTPVRALNADEAGQIKEYLDGDSLERMFSEATVDEGMADESKQKAKPAEHPAPEAPTKADDKPEDKPAEAPSQKAEEPAPKPEAEPQEEAPKKEADKKPTARDQAMDEGEPVDDEATRELDSILSNVLD